MTSRAILEKIKNIKSLNNSWAKKSLFVTVFILVFLRILSFAWCCDDAYHAYIMSVNLLAGKGFTPTPGIRVNASTCPLWTLVVTLGMVLWNNPYAIGMILNLLFSGIALFMLFKFIYKKDDWFVILFVVAAWLCFSKSYLSYTTSGLENAQILMLSSFYLAVLFKNEYFSKKELFKIALFEGLIAFTRMDCALILAFTSAYVFLFRYKKDEKDTAGFSLNKLLQVIPVAILGLSPFILWEFFSWFYYGSFIPNTALAKLNTGFPLSDYLIRGVWYFAKTGFFYDPLVLLVPILFIVSVAKTCKDSRNIKEICLASGIILYLFYIVYIGGDFMRGRHFLSLFWIALISLVYLKNPLQRTVSFKWFSVFFVISGTLFLLAGFLIFMKKVPYGCTDEQQYYYHSTGLSPVLADYSKNGKITIISENKHLGIQWFHGNKGAYEYRLYDPLLSRLPAVHDKDWAIGHMQRKIPAGYQKTLNTGINYIEDKNLAFYYDKLKFILSGDLLDFERLKEIVKFNSGAYEKYRLQYIKDSK
jgi:arabinofuranosyltransferase